MQTFFDNKVVKIVLGIAGIIGLVSLLAKVFGKSDVDKKRDENMKKGQQARQDKYKKVPPSYSDNVYEDYADALHNALGAELYEDEDTVFTIFKKMKNISDVNKLIDFYGHPRVAGTMLRLSLPSIISRVFNASEKAKLNKILSDRKINYRFN